MYEISYEDLPIIYQGQCSEIDEDIFDQIIEEFGDGS